MSCVRPRVRSSTMAIGVQVLVGAPLLDELFEAIQKHADWGRQPPLLEGFEEAARKYHDRDAELYEAASRMRAEVAAGNAGAAQMPLGELLAAIQIHLEQAHLTRVFRGLKGLVRLHEERDVRLYDAAASVRVKAFRGAAEAGIYLDRESIEAILAGEKTAMRMPVEFTHTGKHLPGYYSAAVGERGSYAVLAPVEGDSSRRCRVVRGYRLKVLDAQMERLGDVSDEEARLEGFASRAALFSHVLERDGALNGDQQVWRYELEPIEQ